jgi:hypothetical protein
MQRRRLNKVFQKPTKSTNNIKKRLLIINFLWYIVLAEALSISQYSNQLIRLSINKPK